MDERLYNRLLRRVDWRFLLANPAPEKSICFGNGILRQAVEQISSMSVEPGDPKMGQCDLTVALNPTQAVLQSAFAALCPGGEIYTEWYSPMVGGAKGIRRRLEKMGFTNVICYWAWPPPMLAPSLYWLPLDSAAVLQYFFGNRPLSKSVVVRIGRFLLQKVIALGLHTRLLMPVHAVARKPGCDGQEDFRTLVNKEIIGYKRLEEAPSHLDWMLWTPGHRSINKIIAFVFSETEDKPILVMKTTRSLQSAQSLASEVHNLVRLATTENLVAGSTPSVLFTFDWKNLPVVGETYVAGSPMFSSLTRDNYQGLALKVTNWLIALAKGSRLSSPRSEWWDRLVEPVLQEFSQSFGSIFTPQEICIVHNVLNRLPDLPVVFEQRDCSPWNILVNNKDEIKVLDWESSEANGLPLMDLIYFLTYLSFFINGVMESKEYAKAYRDVFNPQSLTGRINHDCLEKYCAEMNLDPSIIEPLRLLTWLIHSRPEHQRFVDDSGGKPSPSALRLGLFATLIREEIQLYSKVDG